MFCIRFVLFAGMACFASGAGAEPVASSAQVVASVQGTTLYDPDSGHLWNRLHEALFVRVDPKTKERLGEDILDPLIWRESKYPLVGESHAKILAMLDEFTAQRGERLIVDPRRRAALQLDLWFLFDWAEAKMQGDNSAPARELAVRLATLLRRLALTPAEIAALGDNYAEAAKGVPGDFDPAKPAEPFLPKDLFSGDGAWVLLDHDWRSGSSSLTPRHEEAFGHRSAFSVFISLPGGRDATRAYLGKLKAFPNPVLWKKSSPTDIDLAPALNPAVPNFPEGTRVALVRRALLISPEGRVEPTPLTLSVQLRVYRKIQPVNSARDTQAVFEFSLQKKAWFARRSGGLHAYGTDEKDFNFVHFFGHGADLIEHHDGEDASRSPVLQSCLNCHFDAGVRSLLSYSRFNSIPAVLLENKNPGPYGVSLTKKISCREWGVLTGLWLAEERRRSAPK